MSYDITSRVLRMARMYLQDGAVHAIKYEVELTRPDGKQKTVLVVAALEDDGQLYINTLSPVIENDKLVFDFDNVVKQFYDDVYTQYTVTEDENIRNLKAIAANSYSGNGFLALQALIDGAFMSMTLQEFVTHTLRYKNEPTLKLLLRLVSGKHDRLIVFERFMNTITMRDAEYEKPFSKVDTQGFDAEHVAKQLEVTAYNYVSGL